MIISVITWIVFGALAGWLASVITRTSDSQGAVDDIIVGIIGALIGGFVTRAFTGTGLTGFDFRSLVIAVLGSVVLLLVLKSIRRPHAY